MKLVLIVEDEFGHAEVMQLVLEGAGYRVVTAANGIEALALMEDERPAVILSDFMMPVMHGGELGRAVRRDPALFHIPIVFMSGTSEDVVRQSFPDYDAFLPKPYEITDLLLLVAHLIQNGRPSLPKSEDVKKSVMRLLKGLELPPGFNVRLMHALRGLQG